MPAQVASARVFRYKAALREYSEARRGTEPDKQWQAMLLIVTATILGRRWALHLCGQLRLPRPSTPRG